MNFVLHVIIYQFISFSVMAIMTNCLCDVWCIVMLFAVNKVDLGESWKFSIFRVVCMMCVVADVCCTAELQCADHAPFVLATFHILVDLSIVIVNCYFGLTVMHLRIGHTSCSD